MDLLKRRLDIAHVIAREFLGIQEKGEQNLLECWLQEDERHRMEYEEIRQLLVAGEEAWKELEDGDLVAAACWQELQWEEKRRSQWWVVWYRYASIVVLMLAVGIYYFAKQESPETITHVETAAVTPGGGKAQLTLADGRKMQLDDTIRLTFKEVGGTDVSLEVGVVKYSGVDTADRKGAYNTLTVPRGGEFALVLADGTRIWLNSESSLKYPVAFTGNERRVEMTGEVYFEVARNAAAPFVVEVRDMDVRVLGTCFNVTAYGANVVTTLVEGSVRLNRGEEHITLSPDQQGTWNGDKFEMREVDAQSAVLWKEGIFYFENDPLEVILETMARWYDVGVFYADPELKNMHFSVKIKRYENINKILGIIAQTNRVRFEIKDRVINVYE